MNINYKEPQFELFPANSATLEDINKPKFLLATMTLSTESLVILVILGIMIALFSFSLGVERGKHLAALTIDEKVSAAWNVGGRRLAVVAPSVTLQNIPVRPVAKISNNAGIVHSSWVSKTAVGIAPRATITRSLATTMTNTFSSRWTIQVATYRNENYAQQEALGLKGKVKGYPVFIVKSKDFYLVCIGQYGSQSQADILLKKIQMKFQGSQIRRF